MPNTLNTKSQQTKATFSKLVNQTVRPSEPTKKKYGQGCTFRNTVERTYELRLRAVKWETLGFVITFFIHISGEKTLLIL